MKQLQKRQLVTIVAAVGICNLMELEKLVQPQSRVAGQIRRIYESLTNIAGTEGIKLDEDEWVLIGVAASNAGMKVISKAVQAAEPKKQRSSKKAIA